MPGVTGEPARLPLAGPATDHGLVLEPFRGVRYDPSRIRELADVTAPPYDLIDAEDHATLETADPHNIVRLILPRQYGSSRKGRYATAARTLRAWLRAGVLAVDPEPGLYVYEQASHDLLQRGLIGALALRTPEERIVLPHEDVMPGPVADRLELMRATAANLEPILLQYEGGRAAARIVDAVAETAPLAQAVTTDGTRHRIWWLGRPEAATVHAELAGRQALIADGHHRYATYLKLQAEHHNAGHGAGPWDYGLALLVDATRYPFHMRAVHRVLTHRRAEELASRVRPNARVAELPRASPETSLDRLDSISGPAWLLVGSERQWLISDVDGGLVERSVPQGLPAQWRRLDATVLHHVLLDHVWGVPDDVEAIGYHHSVRSALRHAESSQGSAVLLRPVEVATVLALARQGVRMPRKSTSFGPKPRSGLVLRIFAAG
jgi:uncharacterized protein (DUF1015 family)